MARTSAPEPIDPIWITPPPKQRLDPIERWFIVVLRIIALVLLVRAIHGWLLIVGILEHPELGRLLVADPYVRFALFGILTVASIIACVGLWLLAPWGAVLWLVIVAADALIFFLLPNLGIVSIIIVLTNAGLVSVYLGMLLQVRRLSHEAPPLR
jgi:hypothetical protein